ncbi:YeiH family protein [Rhodococcus aetherivorans]
MNPIQERMRPTAHRKATPAGMSRIGKLSGELAPGVAMCLIVAILSMAAARFLPAVSPLLIAIVIGAVGANLLTVPQRLQPGMTFSSKKLLRVGIALLGLQLMLADIFGLGWKIMAVVVAVVSLGIVGTMLVGRLLGLSWTQRVLIACGFSICGAAAVAATDGVVDADEEEVLTAVALVVIFGTLMIPTVPLVAGALGLEPTVAGLWAGGAIHEVAQVVAVGGIIGGGALTVAAIVKLARVLMLAPVIATLGILQRRRATDTTGQAERPPLVPFFVLGFLACAALRTTGIVPDNALTLAKSAQTLLLTAAMFALGAGVRVSLIKKVGPRPFVLATVSTAWVASIALVGVLLVV